MRTCQSSQLDRLLLAQLDRIIRRCRREIAHKPLAQNTMRIIRTYPPNQYADYHPDNTCGWKCAELTAEETSRFRAIGADTLIYWYATGCYSGAGYALFRVDNFWRMHDISHCSCYGPTDGINAPHTATVGQTNPVFLWTNSTSEVRNLTRLISSVAQCLYEGAEHLRGCYSCGALKDSPIFEGCRNGGNCTHCNVTCGP